VGERGNKLLIVTSKTHERVMHKVSLRHRRIDGGKIIRNGLDVMKIGVHRLSIGFLNVGEHALKFKGAGHA